jgi:hypothetical protein
MSLLNRLLKQYKAIIEFSKNNDTGKQNLTFFFDSPTSIGKFSSAFYDKFRYVYRISFLWFFIRAISKLYISVFQLIALN